MKSYYLAGPMTGLPEYNFPAFDALAKLLRGGGLTIRSPHEIDHGEAPETRGQLPYGTYMREALKMMLDCDGIILLPGWKKSEGACMEVRLAKMCGMELHWWDDERHLIFTLEDWELKDAGIL